MTVDKIFEKIDKWVESKQGRGWIETDFIPHDPSCNPEVIQTIQQVRQELYDFVSLLFEHGYAGGAMLEIGLGRNAGTHRVWREIFSKVLSIELSMERIENAKSEFGDDRSLFVCGSSRSPKTIEEVRRLVAHVDVLFIDGDHSFGGIWNDYDLYSEFVRSGGLIAFHDSECDVNEMYGVPQFLRELASGDVDGLNHDIRRIVHSKKIGIAYEFVK